MTNHYASGLTLQEVRQWPKSDLHNHGLLGGTRHYFERRQAVHLGRFTTGRNGIKGLNEWIMHSYRPVMQQSGAFETAIEAAFFQARRDGIVKLEMSIDAMAGNLSGLTPAEIVRILKQKHREIAPDIDFKPELGFPRTVPLKNLLTAFDHFMSENYFTSIDLYDDESAAPPEQFRELFSMAKKLGLQCKAHAGEFGSAESVRHAVEVLGLDAVQHGIGAADSPEVMRWLSANRIRLNVCPASNIRLHRVRNYRSHPIRMLYDHGVTVTINTDDALIFGAGVSEQILRLVRCDLFSIPEIKEISRNGLGQGSFFSL